MATSNDSNGKDNIDSSGQSKTNRPGHETGMSDAASNTKVSDGIDFVEQIAQRASEVVGKSAAILEEEIAAGILAAKQVEEKFINVEELRGGDNDRLSRKVRRDIHEIVDIIVDLAESGIRGAGGLVQRAVRLKPGRGNGRHRPVPGNIPTLMPASPLEPGGTAEVCMTLENDSDSETSEFAFRTSDLINAITGDRISSTQITVTPAPVVIEPKGQSNVTINVEIPTETAPGCYSGLLQATDLDQLRAILSLQIS